jgi:hypothetical protein
MKSRPRRYDREKLRRALLVLLERHLLRGLTAVVFVGDRVEVVAAGACGEGRRETEDMAQRLCEMIPHYCIQTESKATPCSRSPCEGRPMTSERNQAILADREQGLSFRVIGARHGLGPERIRQIVWRQERIRATAAWEASWPDPTTVPDDYPLADVPLPPRLRLGLANMGLATVGDVRRATDPELRRQPNLGAKSVKWLRRFGTAPEAA